MHVVCTFVVMHFSSWTLIGIIHKVGPETEPVQSLASLQCLRRLERLNLKQTQVSDEALYAISSFQELTHLSLGSKSLTNLSLCCLSSLPKLTNLSINDAVMTVEGLYSFKPPTTLRMIDLRGCWLLTEHDIVSFCRRHPQIEVTHEHVRLFASDHIGINRPSPSRSTLKTCEVNEVGKLHISPFFIGEELILLPRFSN